MNDSKGNLLLYQTEDGQTKIEVTLANDTVWLTADQMAELFQRNKSTISRHIKNVFESGELNPDMRLSQNRVEMASFVLFQIEVIWIFFKREVYNRTFEDFILSSCFPIVISLLRGYFCKIMCNGQQAESCGRWLRYFRPSSESSFSRSLSLIFLRRWFACTILSDRLL